MTDNDTMPEGWQWDDEGLIISDWLCDHTWLEIRSRMDGGWWTELWLTPDKCEGETHIEGFDVWGDTYTEVMNLIGPIETLDVKTICHYCSGEWPLPLKDED